MKEENICKARSYFPTQEEVNGIAAELDQTAKADAGKPQLTLVPTEVIKSAYGIIKYQNDLEACRASEIPGRCFTALSGLP